MCDRRTFGIRARKRAPKQQRDAQHPRGVVLNLVRGVMADIGREPAHARALLPAPTVRPGQFGEPAKRKLAQMSTTVSAKTSPERCEIVIDQTDGAVKRGATMPMKSAEAAPVPAASGARQEEGVMQLGENGSGHIGEDETQGTIAKKARRMPPVESSTKPGSDLQRLMSKTTARSSPLSAVEGRSERGLGPASCGQVVVVDDDDDDDDGDDDQGEGPRSLPETAGTQFAEVIDGDKGYDKVPRLSDKRVRTRVPDAQLETPKRVRRRSKSDSIGAREPTLAMSENDDDGDPEGDGVVEVALTVPLIERGRQLEPTGAAIGADATAAAPLKGTGASDVASREVHGSTRGVSVTDGVSRGEPHPGQDKDRSGVIQAEMTWPVRPPARNGGRRSR